MTYKMSEFQGIEPAHVEREYIPIESLSGAVLE